MSSLVQHDRDLIASARLGDLLAFNSLIGRWERRVYAYLLRSTGNREDAMDVCQDVFLKAFRGLGGLASTDRFPGWLFRIAHNELVSARRRAKPTVGLRDFERAVELSTPPRSQLGEFGYGRAELVFLVEQALGSLPPKQREIVLLKVHHGFKFHEIAEIVGCPVSTAKSRLYAGLAALRKVLEPVGAR